MGLLSDRGGSDDDDDGNSDSRRDLKADLQPTSEYFCVNRAAWLGDVRAGEKEEGLRVWRRCRCCG
ncbi:hypothetical protein PG996_002499 [Apiospora saccharicola]|uniref:Uncharacterized protein n=1 Tax=Apiospora saccharicola TaxID=335842 RepID=A0ABR1WNX7_9PEZI